MLKLIREHRLANPHKAGQIYLVQLLKDSGDMAWMVKSLWGQTDGKLNSTFECVATREEADKLVAAKIGKKRSDGYVPEGEDLTSELLFYPMKAIEGTPEETQAALVSKHYVAEEKFDGARYLMKIFGSGSFVLHSRLPSVKTNLPVDKTENVPHFWEELQIHLSRSEWPRKLGPTVLDGEVMWADGKPGSVMGMTPENALARQKEKSYVYFVVYDLPYFDGKALFNTPMKARRALLVDLFPDDGPFIRLAKQTSQNKEQFLKKVWARNGEGIILKDIDGKYFPGRRPKGVWLKIKKVVADEFVVIGFEAGQGKYKGQVGSIIFGQYNAKGKLIPISLCSGFTDAERKKMSADPESYIGQVVEVKYQETTTGDAIHRARKLIKVCSLWDKAWAKLKPEDIPHSLRHPRFLCWRDDKAAKECVFPELR